MRLSTINRRSVMGTADRTAYLLANPKDLEAFVAAAEKNADDWLALNREARVLVEFAKTAPGRLPSRVQEAVAYVSGVAPTEAPSMTNAQIYSIADQHGTRFRTADEEGMTFDKHAVLDFARAILARSAEAPVASAIGEVIARVVHRTAGMTADEPPRVGECNPPGRAEGALIEEARRIAGAKEEQRG
jgi:hypothetical protein